MNAHPVARRPGRSRRRFLVLAVVRPVVTTAALVTVYYLLPVDRELDPWTLVLLVGELAVVVALIGWQIRRILRSPYPTLQGVQALALILPMFLLIYANVYFVVAHNEPAAFTTPLTRSDALYFVVTVFATVGFGDIVPVSEGARLLVTAQMIGNLLVLGIALRVILTAVQYRRARAADDAARTTPQTPTPDRGGPS